MSLKLPHSAYFIGAGGIGMSALARWLQHLGVKVYGYDRVRSQVAQGLEAAGIRLTYDSSIDAIPGEFLEVETKNALVVITPAIPKGHAQLTYFRDKGYRVLKRSELIGHLLEEYNCFAVAGTHGKTTTTCMLAHILHTASVPAVGLLGGISVNFEGNFHFEKDAHTAVVEADEFDRSFHMLKPGSAIITSCDADHLDIYGSEESLRNAFQEFAASVEENGNLLLHEKASIREPRGVRTFRYGIDPQSDFYARNISVKQGSFHASLYGPGMEITDVRMGIPGRYNVENALAAAAVAKLNGVSENDIRKGLETFRGVKRRFERVADNGKLVYIDDYAHHPKEIDACVGAARELYPSRTVTGVFQPHLFSRTRDFMDGFAASLSHLDRVWLIEIYPAREEPIPGITSEALLKKIDSNDKELMKREDVLARVDELEGVLLTIGAGDIDQLVEPIKEKLSS